MRAIFAHRTSPRKRWHLFVVGCCIALTLPAHGTTNGELTTQAEADIAAGRYDAALAGYDEILRSYPRSGDALAQRAVCHAVLHHNQEAQLDDSRAQAAYLLANGSLSRCARCLAHRADLARESGDTSAAFTDAFSASTVDDKCTAAFGSIADAWYAVGNIEQARDFLVQARKLDDTLTRDYSVQEAESNGRNKVQPDDAADIVPDFNAAYAAEQKNTKDEAIALYDRVLAKSPLRSGAWGNRGNCLHALGRNAEAVLSLSRAVAIASSMEGKPADLARYFTNRLGCWLDLGDPEAAVMDGELAIKADSSSGRSWQQLAYAWYQWGDLDKAQASLAEARKRNPVIEEFRMTEKEVLANRSVRLARQGDTTALQDLVDKANKYQSLLFDENRARATAITILDELLKKSPRNVPFLILRAQAENAPTDAMHPGTSKEALAMIERALVVDPSSEQGLLVRGLFRLDLPTADEALKTAGYADLDRAIQNGAATAAAYARRAAHAMEQKKYADAIADLTSALYDTPDDLALLRLRATANERNETWVDALSDRARVVELSPDSVSAFTEYADTRLDAESYDGAVEMFTAAIKLDPETADHYIGRAQAYRQLGQRKLARADYQQARVLDPTLPELDEDGTNAEEIETQRHNLQRTMRQMIKANAAVSDSLLKMSKSEKKVAHAAQQADRSFNGDHRSPEQILAEFAQAEKDETADARDYCDRAQALIKLKRLDEALADYDKAVSLEPENAENRVKRGDAKLELGRFAAAIADYDKALELNPDHAAASQNRDVARKRLAKQ